MGVRSNNLAFGIGKRAHFNLTPRVGTWELASHFIKCEPTEHYMVLLAGTPIGERVSPCGRLGHI